MKTQDTIDNPTPPSSPPPRSKGKARLATLAAFLIVALLVAASAVVYAQLGQHRKGQSHSQPSTSPPPARTWTQVWQGYTFASIMAAGSDPSMLYACAVPTNTNAASYTILRSTDFGTHWQDVGSKANLGSTCQLAINPANSSEVYATGTSINGQSATSILLHSTDGGQTWSSIQPTLNVPGTTTAPVWSAQQLSMVGNALFGVQWLLPNTARSVPLPKAYARFTSLITSTDGGHTWTVIDRQFTSARQLVSSYAVDPSNTNTIYELVGTPWLPIEPAAEPDIATVYSNNDTLYKTTDHGATWQLLLQNLPFGTQLHLASGNPQILYVGGSRTPLPLSKGAPVTDGSVPGSFHLQVSRDSGSTWHDVPAMPNVSPEISIFWLVSPNGQVYVSPPSNGSFSGQPTPVTGTVVPSNHLLVPPTVPQSKAPATTGDLLTAYQSLLTTPPPSYTPAPLAPILRYDPVSNVWSTVTTPPAYGTLLATTSGSANGTVLWLLSTQNAQENLYRYLA